MTNLGPPMPSDPKKEWSRRNRREFYKWFAKRENLEYCVLLVRQTVFRKFGFEAGGEHRELLEESLRDHLLKEYQRGFAGSGFRRSKQDSYFRYLIWGAAFEFQNRLRRGRGKHYVSIEGGGTDRAGPSATSPNHLELVGETPDPFRALCVEDVEKAMEVCLSAIDSEALRLRYFEGFSDKEIAARQNRSPSAIRKQRQRALRRIADYLEKLSSPGPSSGPTTQASSY